MRKVIYASLVVSMFFVSSCNKDSESNIKPVTALSKPQEIVDKNKKHAGPSQSDSSLININYPDTYLSEKIVVKTREGE